MQNTGMDLPLARGLLDNMATPGVRFTPPLDMRRNIRAVERLPPMPDMARRILALAADSRAGARELAVVVEQDPSLTAQVIRWASSPFYGYAGRLSSVQEAIARVLGYDLVMNLALGLATVKPLRVPANGPIGLRAFWRHATYSAALVQELARRMPVGKRPHPGTAYLVGLLYDLGFLLLGHLFPKEFAYLNRLIEANPEIPVIRLERFALGVDHGLLGLWLMEAWEMPAELNAVLIEHHNPEYRGEHAGYVLLAFVADRLLAHAGVGVGVDDDIPAPVLEALGLSWIEADEALDTILGGSDDLEALSRQIAA